MVKDKTFLAEAEQQQMDINPHTGAEVAKVVAEIVNTPPASVQKVKEINAAAAATGGGEKKE
jgi:hypothetical protein